MPRHEFALEAIINRLDCFDLMTLSDLVYVSKDQANIKDVDPVSRHDNLMPNLPLPATIIQNTLHSSRSNILFLIVVVSHSNYRTAARPDFGIIA